MRTADAAPHLLDPPAAWNRHSTGEAAHLTPVFPAPPPPGHPAQAEDRADPSRA
jgi:hypothetical protein